MNTAIRWRWWLSQPLLFKRCFCPPLTRTYGSRVRLAPLEKMLEFRKGPYSALPLPDAPQPPEKLPPPARYRLAFADAKEALSNNYLFILQNVSIPSNSLHVLKNKIKTMSAFKMKMVPPSIITTCVRRESSLLSYDLSWIAGPIFLAFSNQKDSKKAYQAFLALKSEPLMLFLGGRFEKQFFTHEGIEDLLKTIPPTKESLVLELISLLYLIPHTLNFKLLLSPQSLVSSLQLRSKI